MSRSATARKKPPQGDPTIPEILIPPSQAKDSEREAYWLQLIDDPEQLRAAMETTEFWPMLQEFPDSLWGSHLSIYLYRLEDDGGLMVKNQDGQGKYIKPVIRCAIDEEWIANKHGGGKYQAWLKWDNNATLRKHTFRIDGPPKVQPGQTVEIDGKTVPIAAPAAAPPAEPHTDLATVIEANKEAQRAAIDTVTETAKTMVGMVKDQASAQANAAQNQPNMIELLTTAKNLFAQPQVNMLEIVKTVKELFTPTAAVEEPKDPPLTEAMELLERFSGKTFADMMKGGGRAANPDPAPLSWLAPFAPAIDRFVGILPVLMSQTRTAKDLEFARAVWLRTAKPGEAPPANLLHAATVIPPTPQPAAPPASNGAQPATEVKTNGAAPDMQQVLQGIVQFIIHGFDRDPLSGRQTAAVIEFHYGDLIRKMGLQEFLCDEAKIKEFVAGHPELAQRANSDVRWKDFEADFVGEFQQAFGKLETDTEESEPSVS